MQTNEKPQHTPGPWRTVPTTAKAAGLSRLDVVTDALPFAPSYIAGDILPEDARLIAAAPEMLAALRRISALCARLTESQGYNEDGNACWLGPIAYEIAGAAFEATTKAQGAA